MLNVRYTNQMKRLFVFFSIILLLGSNIAMALDTDCLSNIQQHSTIDQDQDQNSDIDSADDCCHSASHFVGIYPDVGYKVSIIANQYLPLPLITTTSQTYQPATPPPTV